MTRYEKEILYPDAKRLLELLGYNTDEKIYDQFLNRYQEIVNNPAPKNKGGRPKKYKKKLRNNLSSNLESFIFVKKQQIL